jgi:hypothetical protein
VPLQPQPFSSIDLSSMAIVPSSGMPSRYGNASITAVRGRPQYGMSSFLKI